MSDLLAIRPRAEEGPVVNTQYGPVLGLTTEGVNVFKGVPFAQPPVKKLRFLPPRPPENWVDPLCCQTIRCSAMQASEISPLITHSEDCLYLNLWAPAGASPGDNLPVYVYIHGGGFSEGSPSKPIFDGTHFAKDGIIQVNVTYRLGALGFMAFEKTEAEHGFLGNCGLQDQLAALRWVQANIAAFGGDPGQVTVGGESAGAFSVSGLILSPLAKGLFQRAILQSGNLLGQPILAPVARGSRRQAILMSRGYAAALNRPAFPALQKLDAKLIARGSPFSDDVTSPTRYNFWPVFDGHLLPENPYDALLHAPINEVDLLTGYNTDEGTLFVPKNTSEESYLQLCWRIFGENAYEVLQRFPCEHGTSAATRARNLLEMGLRFGSDVFSDEMSRRGKRVWHYNFNHHIPLLDRIGLGTPHAIELVFIFKTIPRLLLRNPTHAPMMEDMHARWLNFIKTGNPNEGSPVNGEWPPYTAENRQTMVLQSDACARPTPGVDNVAFYRDILWNS